MKANTTLRYGRIFLLSLLTAAVFSGILLLSARLLFPQGIGSHGKGGSGGSPFLLAEAKAPKPYSIQEREKADPSGPEEVLSFAASTSGAALSEGTDGTNRLYSPVSLYANLCLLADGARGDTKEQLLGILGCTSETLRPMNEQMFRTLTIPPAKDAKGDEKGKNAGTMNLANSLWVNQFAVLDKGYAENLAKNFYTSTFQADLTTEEVGSAVSKWISENTGGKQSQNLFSQEEETENALIHFVNALYFHGLWETPFDPGDTKSMDFHLADQSTVSADFMTQSQTQSSYYQGEGFVVAGLNFNRLGSMDFLLPDEGKNPLSLLKDGTALSALFSSSLRDLEGTETGVINYYIPKFSLDLESNLLPTISALGIETDLNLGNLSEDSLTLGKVRQYNTFAIDEKGAEASSVTDISAPAAAPPDSSNALELRLNRPFLFVLRESGGYPLFVGIIENPMV